MSDGVGSVAVEPEDAGGQWLYRQEYDWREARRRKKALIGDGDKKH